MKCFFPCIWFSTYCTDRRNSSVMELGTVGLMVWKIMQTNKYVYFETLLGAFVLHSTAQSVLFKETWMIFFYLMILAISLVYFIFLESKSSGFGFNFCWSEFFIYSLSRIWTTSDFHYNRAGHRFNVDECKLCLSRKYSYNQRGILLQNYLREILS